MPGRDGLPGVEGRQGQKGVAGSPGNQGLPGREGKYVFEKRNIARHKFEKYCFLLNLINKFQRK